MRYIEITHVYVLQVPDGFEDTLDAVAEQGMSIMERFIEGRAANIQSIKSDWKMLPKEYRPTQPVQELTEVAQVHDEIIYERGSVPTFTDTPHERDRIESLKIIEADSDQGISFTGDIMGQRAGPPPHPWDQGLRVTPEGHDLFAAETEALRQESKLCGYDVGGASNAECVLVAGHPGSHLFVKKQDTVEGSPKEITDGEH